MRNFGDNTPSGTDQPESDQETEMKDDASCISIDDRSDRSDKEMEKESDKETENESGDNDETVVENNKIAEQTTEPIKQVRKRPTVDYAVLHGTKKRISKPSPKPTTTTPTTPHSETIRQTQEAETIEVMQKEIDALRNLNEIQQKQEKKMQKP